MLYRASRFETELLRPSALYAADIIPWTINHNGGSAGCVLDPYSYYEVDHAEYYGD